MWKKGHDDHRTLWMDITAHERRFHISLFGYPRGLIAKSSQLLDAATFANLQLALQDLTNPHRTPEPEAFRDFGALLFELVLPEPIQVCLQQHEGPVVFETQELSLPWELLCPDQDFLCLKHAVSRQLPMLDRMSNELLGQQTFSPRDDEEDAALIIANATGDLPSAADEAEELCEILQQHGLRCDTLIGPQECTYQNILATHIRRRPYRIVHISGHAQYLPEKETSAILLADGRMILAQELQRTFKGEPLVFLNACWSALENSVGKAPVESQYAGAKAVRTLTEAFSFGNRSGRVQAIVGSMWWIADSVARGLARHFYQELMRGHPLGEALRLARQQVAAAQSDPALWSTYVLFGDAGLRYVPKPKPSASPTSTATLRSDWGSDSGYESVSSSELNSATDVPINDRFGDLSELTGRPKTGIPEAAEPEASTTDVREAESVLAETNLKRSEVRSATSDGSDSAAPATSPAETFGGELAEGLPWADDIRAAFVGAMAAMTAMRWPVFSTVHLVLGLTYVSHGLVAAAIGRSGVDPAKARRALRELFTQEATANEQKDSIVSDNLKSILLAAKTKAVDSGATEVGEAHLVFALLDRNESGGTLLLHLLKIDLDKLRAEAQQLLTGKRMPTRSDFLLPDGSLDRTQFEDDCWSTLEESTRMAYRSYWPDLRSPHLFLGLLNRRGSQLAEHLRQTTKIVPNTLASSFLAMLLESSRVDASLGQPKLHREFLSENALNTLRAAQQVLRLRDGEKISERDLLTAIFDNENNVVTSALHTAGIETQALMW